jgi:flagellar biosynthesis/type III secretory pathway chaperone
MEDCAMERPVELIYGSLQKLVGLYRQLLDTVRVEKDSLVQADLRGIQEATCAKQALIETIRQEETRRLKHLGELAFLWKKPLKDLTLGAIVIAIQGRDSKGADQLRSVFNTLTILVKRVSDQNLENKALVERTLDHITQMKKNVLGEASLASNTYTQQGTRSSGPAESRLISKEA